MIIERIFTIRGMGMLMFDAILRRDYPVIMGVVTLVALITLLAALLAVALSADLLASDRPLAVRLAGQLYVLPVLFDPPELRHHTHESLRAPHRLVPAVNCAGLWPFEAKRARAIPSAKHRAYPRSSRTSDPRILCPQMR